MSNARLTMDTADWYTPAAFVDSARVVMGCIDLDPASHPEANMRVKAANFHTAEDDGLSHEWRGCVFLNPPGGKHPSGGSLTNAFWRHLLCEYMAGRVSQAVWIGYSLEQLQTLQNSGASHTPLAFPLCVTRNRIAFVENEAKREARIAKKLAAGKSAKDSGPTHSNYICYLGPQVLAFAQEFGKHGAIVLPTPHGAPTEGVGV